MPTHIGLPDEHAERIRRFADAQKITMADAIGELIQIAVEAGKIPAGLPGYEVTRSGSTITITAEGGYRRSFNLELAKAFSTGLDRLADKKGDISKGGISGALNGLAFIGAEQFVGIKRRGNSIKIIDENGNERTLAPSVARELATIVRTAAA